MNRRDVVVVRCLDMVIDPAIYPRAGIDEYHVGRLAEAIRAGVELPEIVLEEGTKRIVDGVHRSRSALRAGGSEATFPCVLRRYENDAALFAEAMLLNSRHGQPLSNYDRTRSILLARRLGIEDGQTAAALQISIEHVEKLVLERTGTGPDAELVPLKFTAMRLAGSHLTAEQLVANRQAGGMGPGFYVRQVLNLVEGRLIDLTDESLLASLERLQVALTEILQARGEVLVS
jgi:hypothetical protein